MHYEQHGIHLEDFGIVFEDEINLKKLTFDLERIEYLILHL